MVKNTQITFRISETIKKEIQEAADKRGMNVADFVRYAVMKQVEEDRKGK